MGQCILRVDELKGCEKMEDDLTQQERLYPSLVKARVKREIERVKKIEHDRYFGNREENLDRILQFVYVCSIPTTNNKIQVDTMRYTNFNVYSTFGIKGKIYMPKLQYFYRMMASETVFGGCFRIQDHPKPGL